MLNDADVFIIDVLKKKQQSIERKLEKIDGMEVGSNARLQGEKRTIDIGFHITQSLKDDLSRNQSVLLNDIAERINGILEPASPPQ